MPASVCAAASQHHPVRTKRTAAAAAKKPVAAFAAVQENIQEKELHVEASESYLAVRRLCCRHVHMRLPANPLAPSSKQQ